MVAELNKVQFLAKDIQLSMDAGMSRSNRSGGPHLISYVGLRPIVVDEQVDLGEDIVGIHSLPDLLLDGFRMGANQNLLSVLNALDPCAHLTKLAEHL
jgi:hypothetical protein